MFEFKALSALKVVCKSQEFFTADDVWAQLDKPAEPRRLGQVLQYAAQTGMIRKTSIFRDSKQGTNHGRPIRVWFSATWKWTGGRTLD